uniref:Ubiquitin fusion degradation protein n=1 Tax=viral metagenome TaxID=1070528 RepID=A0A6C0D2Y6_9ZZZZ
MYSMNKFDYEEGDKIILPSNFLYAFIHLMESGDPLTFRITTDSGKQYHSGVFEFSADENIALLPLWLLHELGLSEGSFVTIERVELTKATKVCILPKTEDIFRCNDIKSALEIALKKFTCLTKDTTIKIRHESTDIFLYIHDVFPKPCVSLFNTDCEVEFIENERQPVVRTAISAKPTNDTSYNTVQRTSRIGTKYSTLLKGYSAFSGKPNKLA